MVDASQLPAIALDAQARAYGGHLSLTTFADDLFYAGAPPAPRWAALPAGSAWRRAAAARLVASGGAGRPAPPPTRRPSSLWPSWLRTRTPAGQPVRPDRLPAPGPAARPPRPERAVCRHRPGGPVLAGIAGCAGDALGGPGRSSPDGRQRHPVHQPG